MDVETGVQSDAFQFRRSCFSLAMKSKSNYKFDKAFKVIICRPFSENCILILYRLNSKHAQYRKLLSICVKEFSMEVIALDKLFCLELITEAFWHQTPSLILLKLK